jgi:hypothetical protein
MDQLDMNLQSGDPIGRAVYNFHFHLINQPIVVHSDDFDDDTIEPSYLFRTYNKMPPLEKKAMSLCKGKILDIGACAGAHSCYLQEKGFDVFSLDTSKLCCDVMMNRNLKNVIHHDIFKFSGQTFDTILLLMNGTGIAGSLDGLDMFFHHLKTLLNPNGQILIDSSDLIYLFTDENGEAIIDISAEKYYGQLTFQTEYQSLIGQPFHWLYVDEYTLRHSVEKNGLILKQIFKGRHYDYLAQICN